MRIHYYKLCFENMLDKILLPNWHFCRFRWDMQDKIKTHLLIWLTYHETDIPSIKEQNNDISSILMYSSRSSIGSGHCQIKPSKTMHFQCILRRRKSFIGEIFPFNYFINICKTCFFVFVCASALNPPSFLKKRHYLHCGTMPRALNCILFVLLFLRWHHYHIKEVHFSCLYDGNILSIFV